MTKTVLWFISFSYKLQNKSSKSSWIESEIRKCQRNILSICDNPNHTIKSFAQTQRNMAKSSKQIECIQIVKLHEKNRNNEERKESEEKKTFHPIVNMTFFPHFAIFLNLIWFPFPTTFAKRFYSRHSFSRLILSVWFYYCFARRRKNLSKTYWLIWLRTSQACSTTKVRFIVTAFFNMFRGFANKRIFFPGSVHRA